MKHIKIKSFRNKLLLSYTLIFGVPIILIGLFLYKKVSYSLETEVKMNSSQAILQKINDVDRIIQDLSRMALTVNSNQDCLNILRKKNVVDKNEQIEDYHKMSQIIEDIIGYRTDIVGFSIFLDDGRNFSMNGESVQLDYDFKKDDWYGHLQISNSYFIGSHYQKQVIDSYSKKVISLSKTIKDPNTKVTLGYVLIDFDTKVLDNIFNPSYNENKISTFIVNDLNGFVYEPRNQLTHFNTIKKYLNKLKASFSVINEILYVEKTKMIFSYYTSPYSRWKIINVIPENQIYKNIKVIRSFTIIIIFCCSVVAFALSFFISLSITEPIKRLIRKMALVERGNFEIVSHELSQDEIGDLERHFDRMTMKLSAMIRRVYKAELASQASEIAALQAQINPHFIYNTLAVIDSMAVIKGNNDVSDMCKALSKLLRYNIGGKEETTIEQELEQIKLYLYIEKKRYGDRFSYNIELDSHIAKNGIIKLLIQPIVENAIVHGVECRRGRVNIDIIAEKEGEDKVSVTIKDTGGGINDKKLEALLKELNSESSVYLENSDRKRGHLGLKNVNSRIKLHYGKTFGINITSEIKVGTIVKLTIPKYFDV